jgi:hypothetical protein
VKRGGLFAGGAVLAVWAGLAASAAVGRAAEEQKISFTTDPPTHAVVGGSYAVSAAETSGGQVYVTLTGACSFRAPEKVHRPPKQPVLSPLVPAVVHFVAAGTCVINATGTVEYGEEPPKASQSFVIEAGPAPGKRQSQTVRFTSQTPADARVGGTYMVTAKASSGLRVVIVSQTSRVCRVDGGTVRLMNSGRCTLQATQRGDAHYRAARPAHRTFLVRRR